jgi:hypothetical protein
MLCLYCGKNEAHHLYLKRGRAEARMGEPLFCGVRCAAQYGLDAAREEIAGQKEAEAKRVAAEKSAAHIAWLTQWHPDERESLGGAE